MADSKRVTLATIAAETGVSVTTISKVLNGRGDVSASTRARVEAQLQRRGYARRGASRSDFVEVVLHELDINWSLEVIEGVREVAAESGLTVSLSVSGDRHAPAAEWLTDVLRRRPAGVVLVFAGLPVGRPAQAHRARHPVRHPRPRRRPGPRDPRGRIGELAGRAARDASPDRPRPPGDRGHHRAGGHDVGPRAHRRIPLGDAGGESARPPRLGGLRRLPRSRRRAARRRSAGAGRTAHRDLRRQRPPGARRDPRRRRGAGSTCRGTCPWSATTTSRWPG